MLRRDGWYEIRQRGSHLIMRHNTKPNTVLFPFHGSKEVPKGSLHKILKDAEIKMDKR